jgi:tRNA(Ile)-lysidine synthase
MRQFSPADVLTFLDANLPSVAGADLCIAYSGGLDSTVLLHAAARIAADDPRYRVRAVHVDHRLHAQSGSWRAHCERAAAALRIELTQLIVDVPREPGASLEAVARDARYGALRGALRPGEIVLTAHHADDQLETILLALMRGAGLRGLSGMPATQRFGAGWLVRPLLGFTRRELEAWARAQALAWISDPSNENVGFDRNYIRYRVVPALYERWPAAAGSATRSAAHLGEANRLLESLAESDLGRVARGACLDVSVLRNLEPARLRNVLRQWIRQCGVPAPSTRKLAAIEHDLLGAREDRVPCVDWEGCEVRRYRGLLYCMRSRPHLAGTEVLPWQVGERIDLPAQLGSLSLQKDPAGRIGTERLEGQPLSVRFRSGGEVVQPAGEAHHRKLKKLLQSAAILPWWRDRLPLVYCDDRLLAVGDLWTAEEFAPRGAEPAARIVWQGRPEVFADNAPAGAPDNGRGPDALTRD